MNWEYKKVSCFEWNYWNNSTFWWYSNLLASTCMPLCLQFLAGSLSICHCEYLFLTPRVPSALVYDSPSFPSLVFPPRFSLCTVFSRTLFLPTLFLVNKHFNWTELPLPLILRLGPILPCPIVTEWTSHYGPSRWTSGWFWSSPSAFGEYYGQMPGSFNQPWK